MGWRSRSIHDEVRPRDVPGYSYALANGVVRPVPRQPPALLPGPTAERMFHLHLLKTAGGVAVYIVLVQLITRFVGGWAEAGLMLTLGLGGFLGWLRLMAAVGTRNAEELRHGYTTFQMVFGLLGFGEGRRWRETGHRAPWDYSGLWVLDHKTGSVKQAPNLDVDAPGFYPSPNREGWLELWTGVVWSGQYRKYPE